MIPTRNGPPKLSLATPMGSHGTPQETRGAGRVKLPPLQVTGLSAAAGISGGYGGAGGGSSDDSAHSRTNSFGASNANYSTSTNSSVSALNLADILRDPKSSQDPLSAYSSSSAGGENDNGKSGNMVLPDLDKLSLEKGRPLDVEDLDDAGWKAAAKESRIVELGSLGEGAGGAVNRCILKGGKTVFALKVCRHLASTWPFFA